MRIPSASFWRHSTILLSSSSAVLEYMKKSGPELKPRLDFPRDGCNGRFGADWVRLPSFLYSISVYVCELGEASGEESEDTSK